MTQDNGLTAYISLGADINKRPTDGSLEVAQGVVSENMPELTLDMKNEDLVNVINKWEKAWNDSETKKKWEKQCEENEKYWLGEHFDNPKADKSRPMVDNLIFEAVETYLPQVTRRNPEPIVTLDQSEESDETKEKYITKVKGRLADLADKNKLRLKLKKGARHWAIYLIGVAKFGWDLDRDLPIVRIVRPKKVLLDPEAVNEEDGYTGNRIGEIRKMEASKILAIMGDQGDPDGKKLIEELSKDNKDTEIQFTEWWTPQYFCWKLKDKILLKKKNPHWNYDKTETPDINNISSDGVSVDDYGAVSAEPVETLGINHFASPKMPYVFLTVFSLGDKPVDNTSLIGQNLANQDKINKRNKQIDKNADRMNGGMVVSLARSGLTQTQAKGVSEALRKGGVVVISDGSPRDAIDQYSPTGLPADVYNDLADTRNRTRDIFGVSGSTPQGVKDEKTVRGKYQIQSLDTDRIGGGVSEYLEQFADDIYNWFVQLLYVYDPAFQFLGDGRPPKIVVSVKEGSLLPKDTTSIANQAIELATSGKMALIDMYKRLEYPDPEELAANVWLEVNAPHLLYENNPKIQQAIQMQQEAAAADAQAKSEMELKKMQIQAQVDLEKQSAASKQSVAEEVAKSVIKDQQTPIPSG